MKITQTFGSRLVSSIALLLLVLAMLPSVSPTGVSAATNAYYVEPSGHSLGNPFLKYWGQNDGLQHLGLPISEIVQYNEKETQFFESGGLFINGGSGDNAEVSRLKAARDVLGLRHDPDRIVDGRRAGSALIASAYKTANPDKLSSDDYLDEKTGHSVKGSFLDYFNDNGGIDTFGRPLSEATTQFGKKIQWFERARIQQDGGEFSLAPVGYELAWLEGIDLSRIEDGDLPHFDPYSSHLYFGDGTVPDALKAYAPVRIMIPSVGIDSYIETIGIIDGVMQVPEDAWAVGWYKELAEPGTDDNVVMAGHKDWWGIGPVVFYNLGSIQVGDMVYLVGEDGSGSTYKVVSNELIDANTDANTVINDTPEETLTLITCGGNFNGEEYTSRNIVKGIRI